MATLLLKDCVYRRTAAGDEALASADTAIPSDYRRILGVIHGDTHVGVVRGSLRQFPDELLADWLAELEEIGFVTREDVAPVNDDDFATVMAIKVNGAPPSTQEDLQRIESQAHAAGAALKDAGAFLSPDRLQHRESLGKDSSETMVLIVEDDPDQLALADLRLSMAGYQVRVARNGKELMEDFRTQPLPDLILLDVMLPDCDGFRVLSGLRRHPQLALLPVIMLTAVEGESNIRRGLALGADGYVTKPYSKKVLTDTIREALKQQ